MAKKKYYAYRVDIEQGVTESWPECQKIVSGIPAAKYKSFESRGEAERWLEAGANYRIKHIAAEIGVYFDAGTGGGNGVEINVADARGNGLLFKVLPEADLSAKGHYKIPGKVTNNYGELLACKYALMVALQDNAQKVFGDSKLIVDYWSKGHIKLDNNDPETVALAREVGRLRWQFEKKGAVIVRISGGANPADLGFHKG
ncbi:MAG: ribonuclease H family protein [Candidatus Pacebacteria bacterium]|jgi:ribonuclease HI|nr:ribonuclease H family protein [Candidatus Paceibacterota bacterium]